MIEALSLPFMQRALAAGLMLALLGGYFGPLVVQRRLAFLGSGLAHAALGGVALGLLVGLDPLWTALPFTLVVAAGITAVTTGSGGKLAGDTAIGIFFSVASALGIVFLALRSEYSADAMAYLFGSMLTVRTGDLVATAAMLLVTASTAFLWPRWAYATFDRELAIADRVPVTVHDYLLSLMLAATVVLAVKVVGILLVAAFLVVPAAASRLVVQRFLTMTVVAILIGLGSVVVGLSGSYALDVPSGAAIILVQALVFFTCLGVTRLLARRTDERPAPHGPLPGKPPRAGSTGRKDGIDSAR